MNCSDVQYLMPLYLAGEMDSASVATFERHTAECPACTRQTEEQLELDKALRASLLSEPVDATALRIRTLAHIKGAPERSGLVTMRHTLRTAFAIAAALLVMVTLGLAYRDNARYEEASADHVDEVVMAHKKAWRTQDQSIGQLVTQRVATLTNLQQLAIPSYQLLRGKEVWPGEKKLCPPRLWERRAADLHVRTRRQ